MKLFSLLTPSLFILLFILSCSLLFLFLSLSLSDALTPFLPYHWEYQGRHTLWREPKFKSNLFKEAKSSCSIDVFPPHRQRGIPGYTILSKSRLSCRQERLMATSGPVHLVLYIDKLLVKAPTLGLHPQSSPSSESVCRVFVYV